MNKKRSKTRSGGLVKTPRIKNILDIGKRLTPGTLVHVTASQWKQLTSRIPTGKGVPKYGVALEFYPRRRLYWPTDVHTESLRDL